MNRLALGLAIHNHQPVGNFPWVFEKAYQTAYEPMLGMLERHPRVRVSLHYTGPLIDWIRAHRPDFFPRLRRLVERGQVDMMTGGYYEPILPSIPESDRVGQIRKMTETLGALLGAHPTGLWLAERVWEPEIPRATAAAGVDWTILDDSHFKMVGLDDADLTSYFVTEDQGSALKIFATSRQLRYLIPWRRVVEVIEYLREVHRATPHAIVLMGDDGEKFGDWPGTDKLCWDKHYMDDLCQALEANADWVETVHLSRWAAERAPAGRIYLPTASYAEMMEWALPATASNQFNQLVKEFEQTNREDVIRYLKGGFWRNFLVKYDEINTMHKKMLRLHDRLAAIEGQPNRADAGDLLAVARDELWQGQCNCPYWHGVFGGSYMNDVRTALFQHLIKGEVAADGLREGSGKAWVRCEQTDFDRDGRDEIVVEGAAANFYLAPHSGGTLFEWDLKEPAHNLFSVMTRRPEAYHQVIKAMAAKHPHPKSTDPSVVAETEALHEAIRTKESGLERQIHYDWYRRASLLDHFAEPSLQPRDFANASYRELGDFVNQGYGADVQQDGDTVLVRLRRDGHVWQGPTFAPVRVEKTLELRAGDPGFVVRYRVSNHAQVAVDARFGVEFNLNVLGGGNAAAWLRIVNGIDRRLAFDSTGEDEAVQRVTFGNEQLGVHASIAPASPAAVWHFSIDSVSNSEGGFERVHQGSSLSFWWPIHLQPGEAWEQALTAES